MSITKRLYLVAGLVAIIALAFSAFTLTSRLTSAQGSDPTADAQTCDAQDEEDDAAEATTEEADTDDVEEECGPQEEADDADGADADDTQEPKLNGSIAVPQSQDEGTSEADEASALAPLATITADEASAAAQAEVPGDVQKVELEDENGSLVYSVDIAGQDVKVDAGTGVILHIEADGAED